MNKKILIGNIIAVTILIGVSFTSVVGYNSVEYNIGVSPLFNIRSSRAIDEARQNLSCKYVGKGEKNSILFPTRNGELSLIYKVIKKINQIGNNFIGLNIQQANLIYFDKEINNKNFQVNVNNLDQILQNNKDITHHLYDEFDNPIIKPFTIYRPIYLLIVLIFILIFGFYLSFISLYAGVTCDPCCFIYDPKTFRI